MPLFFQSTAGLISSGRTRPLYCRWREHGWQLVVHLAERLWNTFPHTTRRLFASQPQAAHVVERGTMPCHGHHRAGGRQAAAAATTHRTSRANSSRESIMEPCSRWGTRPSSCSLEHCRGGGQGPDMAGRLAGDAGASNGRALVGAGTGPGCCSLEHSGARAQGRRCTLLQQASAPVHVCLPPVTGVTAVGSVPEG